MICMGSLLEYHLKINILYSKKHKPKEIHFLLKGIFNTIIL